MFLYNTIITTNTESHRVLLQPCFESCLRWQLCYMEFILQRYAKGIDHIYMRLKLRAFREFGNYLFISDWVVISSVQSRHKRFCVLRLLSEFHMSNADTLTANYKSLWECYRLLKDESRSCHHEGGRAWRCDVCLIPNLRSLMKCMQLMVQRGICLL